MTTTIRITGRENNIASGSVTDGCIHDVEVSSNYRRQGYGTKLVKSLVKLGGNWMWVAASNQAAISLYQSLGFRIVESDGGWHRMEYLK